MKSFAVFFVVCVVGILQINAGWAEYSECMNTFDITDVNVENGLLAVSDEELGCAEYCILKLMDVIDKNGNLITDKIEQKSEGSAGKDIEEYINECNLVKKSAKRNAPCAFIRCLKDNLFFEHYSFV